MKILAAVALIALLAGCATPYPEPQVELEHTPVVNLPPVAPMAPTNGSIYQAAAYRPLFEDHRARLVGDTLTINIIEKVSATQTSTSELSKTGSLSAGVTALPFVAANSFGKASAGATSANDNKGKGSNQNTNEFTGAITAVVTAVLPNGHLMISGEKQIGVNHNVDVLRFSGQVDPRMIAQGNAVPSTSVANVRIEQRGRGATSDAHAIGWLSRFFLNIAPS
ncbi:flagellar basal body L-ring protein FlgH [Roseateles saccharophilus]|uniref:Flagellar L-ring protein n=1 Tax=Roseateles saccharophilus TaxID=304 RepID=A0A4R3V8X5_ROSSA|nr:flagellar basal body L-ring protein FlgH [Roseateles saccharophilus]MDG0834660.1 flagellar basal body L-ring protein FlgH [Roseateles saccharophilus]TCU98894.1 flagellar L-ring protein precursor FlgH [Roseateles saccharophilus]